MSNKKKGSDAERELLKLFTHHGWRAVRVAGSGTNDDSPCDMIAGKAGRKGYTVEAKSGRKKSIYISKEQIEDFILFSSMIGLTPVIALKFLRKGWLFLNPKDLRDSGKFWVADFEAAEEKGERFSQYFEGEGKP